MSEYFTVAEDGTRWRQYPHAHRAFDVNTGTTRLVAFARIVRDDSVTPPVCDNYGVGVRLPYDTSVESESQIHSALLYQLLDPGLREAWKRHELEEVAYISVSNLLATVGEVIEN